MMITQLISITSLDELINQTLWVKTISYAILNLNLWLADGKIYSIVSFTIIVSGTSDAIANCFPPPPKKTKKTNPNKQTNKKAGHYLIIYICRGLLQGGDI